MDIFVLISASVGFKPVCFNQYGLGSVSGKAKWHICCREVRLPKKDCCCMVWLKFHVFVSKGQNDKFHFKIGYTRLQMASHQILRIWIPTSFRTSIVSARIFGEGREWGGKRALAMQAKRLFLWSLRIRERMLSFICILRRVTWFMFHEIHLLCYTC